MSNKRITDLTELTTPTTDDVFPVVDIATNTTTKVQLGNLPTTTAVTTALATKQDTLVSGTNIKTVNSTSLLGSGNVAVQETLVSGTNIKTLNSTSLLGSGNIVLTANPSGVAGAIQFSNGSAFASDAANLFWDDTNNRMGVGTNAPSATGHLKGSGITSATSALLIQNSAGTELLRVRDDGFLLLGETVTYGKSFIASANLNFAGVLFGNNFYSQSDGSTYIGAQTAPSARLQIKGSGSTSATTSLLVQNSAGSASLQVTDDGSVFNYGKGAVSTNTAFGVSAIGGNNTSGNLSAFGRGALQANTSGSSNSAFGRNALSSNSSGSQNTAVGVGALTANTTGSNNSSLGVDTSSGNFSGSVILGNEATATANNQFVVGSATTNAGAVNSTSDVPATFLWSVRINGTNYKILMTT